MALGFAKSTIAAATGASEGFPSRQRAGSIRGPCGAVPSTSTRRAFLLAPLLVAGSVWPAAGAGSVPTHPVPVVITAGPCNPAGMVVGETCAVWHADDGLGASDLGYANLSLWDVPADAMCTNAGSSSRSDWIANGYPDPRVLAGDPPGSEPTYVCADTGSSSRDLSAICRTRRAQ